METETDYCKDCGGVIGTTRARTIQARTYRRRFVREAYPRNGNVHNPTRYYLWDVYEGDKLIDGGFRTRRSAQIAYPRLIDHTEWCGCEPTTAERRQDDGHDND